MSNWLIEAMHTGDNFIFIYFLWLHCLNENTLAHRPNQMKMLLLPLRVSEQNSYLHYQNAIAPKGHTSCIFALEDIRLVSNGIFIEYTRLHCSNKKLSGMSTSEKASMREMKPPELPPPKRNSNVKQYLLRPCLLRYLRRDEVMKQTKQTKKGLRKLKKISCLTM